MKIAIPVWGNRVSPTFDTASNLMLVDIIDGVEKNRVIIEFGHVSPLHRCTFLQQQSVDMLVCGAITKEVSAGFNCKDIKITPFICGNIEQIITALTKGSPIKEMFSMPGRNKDYD